MYSLVMFLVFVYSLVNRTKRTFPSPDGFSLSRTRKKVGLMSNSSPVHDLASPRQIEVLVVQSNPADTLLTIEAFHAAGLTTGLSCVTEGKDALSYVRGEGKYAHVRRPDLIFLDLSQPRVSGL